MNEKLKELYYRDDVIIGSKQNFINIAKKSLNASTKEINEFLKNQEINQVNKKPTKHMNLKITALPKSFQIDMVYYPIGENFKNILLIVDIQSRKAWAYLLSKGTGENILIAYKKFIDEVGQINSVEGDNQFSYKGFVEYNNDKKIRVDTSIARDEHISQGNKLGILDRLVRTLKEMIGKYRTIIGKQGSFSDILDKVIYTYNNQVHRTIKATPNDVFKNIDKQNLNFEKDKEYNRNIISNSNISIGAEARILESKGKLEKGSQKYSMDLYKLIGREGNRFMVENSEGEKLRRRLKPAELQVVKTVESKIDKNIIKEQAAEKKQRQVINKLIRGAEMKKEEALKAVELLKTTPEEKKVRGNRTERDYAALANKTFRTPQTKK
jgi:DNA-binding MltR family transcriptional regulator